MARELHDHWFKEAKREGWRSRAIYKLSAIDEKRKILRKGDLVLDCGCAPGSWLQYVATRVGNAGAAVGIDLLPMTPLPDANVHVMEGDLRTVTESMLREAAGLTDETWFDVVLSDMAPNTTGHRDTDHLRSIDLCNLVLQRSVELLKEGGHLVMKVFEGSDYPDLVRRTGACFTEVRPMRPPASRSVSREMFIVAKGRRPQVELDLPPTVASGPPPIPDAWNR